LFEGYSASSDAAAELAMENVIFKVLARMNGFKSEHHPEAVVKSPTSNEGSYTDDGAESAAAKAPVDVENEWKRAKYARNVLKWLGPNGGGPPSLRGGKDQDEDQGKDGEPDDHEGKNEHEDDDEDEKKDGKSQPALTNVRSENNDEDQDKKEDEKPQPPWARVHSEYYKRSVRAAQQGNAELQMTTRQSFLGQHRRFGTKFPPLHIPTEYSNQQVYDDPATHDCRSPTFDLQFIPHSLPFRWDLKPPTPPPLAENKPLDPARSPFKPGAVTSSTPTPVSEKKPTKPKESPLRLQSETLLTPEYVSKNKPLKTQNYQPDPPIAMPTRARYTLVNKRRSSSSNPRVATSTIARGNAWEKPFVQSRAQLPEAAPGLGRGHPPGRGRGRGRPSEWDWRSGMRG
jgi:hypothetical protein